MRLLRISFILLMVTGVATVAYSQSKSYKIYDTFEGKEGITNFSFSKSMIDAIHLNLGDEEDEKEVNGDLHEIRFLLYNPEKGNFSGKEFTKKAVDCLPKTFYRQFEPEDDNDVEIWLLGNKKRIKECHLFSTSGDNKNFRFVVSFYGDFTVNNLDELKEKGKDFTDKQN